MRLRLISALAALAAFIGLIWYLGDTGLYLWCYLVTSWCAYEYARLSFSVIKAPTHIKVVFWFLAMTNFFVTLWYDHYAVAVIAVSAIVFLTMCLILVQRRTELNHALHIQGVGLMGFIYSGIFPALATKTMQLEGGRVWLYSLLFIVFLGDTMAYLIGRSFGKHKLLAAVSPKKSIEGAFGGMLGSALGGLIMGWFFIPTIPLWVLIPTAVVTGIFAQVGDLFESLIKRVAEVKDSGSIMPGHGGALDRVDGILFSAPIYYVLFRFLIG